VQGVPSRKFEYLVAFAVLSFLSTVYAGAAYWHGARVSEPLLSLSLFISVILVGMWVDADSRGRQNIYRPYEHGWLIYVYWIPYIPYYLWRTRGVKGLLLFVALLALLFSAEIVQWLIYVAR
jgi:hypothetical protein